MNIFSEINITLAYPNLLFWKYWLIVGFITGLIFLYRGLKKKIKLKRWYVWPLSFITLIFLWPLAIYYRYFPHE